MAIVHLKAVRPHGECRLPSLRERVPNEPLRERVLDENLGGYRRPFRLCQPPLGAPAAPQHSIESPAPVLGESRPMVLNEPNAPRVAVLSEQELIDVVWLYKWSHAALRPSSRGAKRRR